MMKKKQRIYLYSNSEKNIIKKGFDEDFPYMEYYPCSKNCNNKTAILICPGGAYQKISWVLEGVTPAKFFNKFNIDVFILHYRINNDANEGHQYPAQYNDVNKALSIIHSSADECGINRSKIGIMGFSAGGHLAAVVSTLNALNASFITPAFTILIYPVISMELPYVHLTSRTMLLGKQCSKKIKNLLSADKNVSNVTPPAILIHAGDDEEVAVQNSILYYNKLKEHNIPAALFLYAFGGHGFGMCQNDEWLSNWPKQVIYWLKVMNFLS